MGLNGNFSRIGLTGTWSRELTFAVVGLVCGAAVLPALIYYAGLVTLGRYEGASLGHIYAILFEGLKQASVASWTVLLGPYALFLLFRGLRTCWRAGAASG